MKFFLYQVSLCFVILLLPIGGSLALILTFSAIVLVIIIVIVIPLVVGVVLLVKRSNKTNKKLQQSICNTKVIPYQGNATQEFHFDGEQQLHLANSHPQQGLNHTTKTENVAYTTHIDFLSTKRLHVMRMKSPSQFPVFHTLIITTVASSHIYLNKGLRLV